MKWIMWIIGGLLVLAALAVAALFATGNGAIVTFAWALLFGAPDLPFDPADAVAPPDYADEEHWAALQAALEAMPERYEGGTVREAAELLRTRG